MARSLQQQHGGNARDGVLQLPLRAAGTNPLPHHHRCRVARQRSGGVRHRMSTSHEVKYSQPAPAQPRLQ